MLFVFDWCFNAEVVTTECSISVSVLLGKSKLCHLVDRQTLLRPVYPKESKRGMAGSKEDFEAKKKICVVLLNSERGI